ncbi:MAG: alpha/beta hydrolase [Nitrospinota bacterium]
MKFLCTTFIVLFLTFSGISLLLYMFQDNLLFFPHKGGQEDLKQFSKHEITFNNNGVVLHGWFIKREISREKPLLIYYGGNAEEVSSNLWDLGKFHTGSLLFMNYRGFGKSQGKPSEKRLFEDALFIFDQIIKKEQVTPDSILVVGRSLGSGVAVYVARHREVRGVILITPFDSVLNIAKQQYPIFPVSFLLNHRFDSLSLAPTIKKPALFLMGSEDTIIPNQNSENLLKHWGGAVYFKVIQGATHNTISDYKEYWQEINSFVSLEH